MVGSDELDKEENKRQSPAALWESLGIEELSVEELGVERLSVESVVNVVIIYRMPYQLVVFPL